MPSFFGHFPMFYAFFSTKTTDSAVTSRSHFLRNHKKRISFPYFWQKSLAHIFKKAIQNCCVIFHIFCVFEHTSMGCFSNSTNLND
jgi:hypothetical protein